MTTTDDHHELEDHDLGLSHDLPRILGRRGLFGIMGGVGAVALVGCADDSGSSTGAGTTSPGSTSPGTTNPGATSPGTTSPGSTSPGATTEPAADAVGGEIPEETAGPFPGDGSNGPDVLSESGVVRTDLTSSFGSASGVAEGVPVTVKLTVYHLNGVTVAALPGAAIYIWHCDREGRYSLYSDGVTEENYLRGVQEADADGNITFTSTFPGCYAGRWPHMHFEVYESLDSATAGTGKLRTSQLALPQNVCDDVYGNVEGYEQSVSNLGQLTLESDMVFSDGYSLQMASATGSIDEGYTISLNVAV